MYVSFSYLHLAVSDSRESGFGAREIKTMMNVYVSCVTFTHGDRSFSPAEIQAWMRYDIAKRKADCGRKGSADGRRQIKYEE